jgi:hypothetical protein
VDGTGCHGLEAQSADASGGIGMDWATAISTSAAYNNSSDAITGTAGFNCSTTDAQLTPYCWHLPSNMELVYLIEQKDVVGGFNTSGSYYWSSSQVVATAASTKSFFNGSTGAEIKTLAYRVRAVRAF